MTDQEYQAFEQQVKKGEKLDALDNFMYLQEKKHREAPPNILLQKEKSSFLGGPIVGK